MWWFPAATGILVLIAGVISLIVYRKLGSPLSMLLGLGLMLGVGINSVIEGYEAYMETTGLRYWSPGGPLWLAVDTTRALFIMLWAFFESMLILEILQWRGLRDRAALSTFLFALGSGVSIYINVFVDPSSKIYGLSPYTLTSYFRVFVFLIPLPLILGYLLIARLYRLSASKGALITGIGFLLHGLTLPTYPILKVSESTLALWYTFGGIVPAFVAVLGIYMMSREMLQ